MVGPNNGQNTSFGPKTIYIFKKIYVGPKKVPKAQMTYFDVLFESKNYLYI